MGKARKGVRKGRKGYWLHGKFYTIRQWKAKHATGNWRRKPRKR